MTAPSPHPDQPLADALLPRWTAAVLRLRPADGPEPAPYGTQLMRRWSEPQRHYHTLAHLAAMLDVIDLLADEAADADTVRLAAWFHDAVYDPARSGNEARSARLAERVLTELALPAPVVAETARLVRLTETHDPAPGDRDGAVLCDADLAVLAGSPAQYAAYAAAVRAEYAFVPDPDFRTGRAAVLEQLLALPALYRTPRARREFTAAAMTNMRTELARLHDRVPPNA